MGIKIGDDGPSRYHVARMQSDKPLSKGQKEAVRLLKALASIFHSRVNVMQYPMIFIEGLGIHRKTFEYLCKVNLLAAYSDGTHFGFRWEDVTTEPTLEDIDEVMSLLIKNTNLVEVVDQIKDGTMSPTTTADILDKWGKELFTCRVVGDHEILTPSAILTRWMFDNYMIPWAYYAEGMIHAHNPNDNWALLSDNNANLIRSIIFNITSNTESPCISTRLSVTHILMRDEMKVLNQLLLLVGEDTIDRFAQETCIVTELNVSELLEGMVDCVDTLSVTLPYLMDRLHEVLTYHTGVPTDVLNIDITSCGHVQVSLNNITDLSEVLGFIKNGNVPYWMKKRIEKIPYTAN